MCSKKAEDNYLMHAVNIDREVLKSLKEEVS